jgi:sugar phosphate isomerase/epimerase
MVGRFFAGNWRPAADEARFAATHGFDCVQLRCDHPHGVGDVLREPAADAAVEFAAAGVEVAIEVLVRAEPDGPDLAAVVAVTVPAAVALAAQRIHLHVVPASRELDVAELELRVVSQLAAAAEVAARHGLRLGLEHNPRSQPLLSDPDVVARALREIPGLGFVWDVNHTATADLDAFGALLGRATLVHLSDTPLPETNHHLPLGLGNVDLERALAALADARYDGPVVLEIGGMPRSGGYGRDTDEALIDSRRRLRAAESAVS